MTLHWRIERQEWVESTNTVATTRAGAGACEGTVIVADGQRMGRGRLGRVWESPIGQNLYASVILRPRLTPVAVQPFTLVVAMALAEAIEAMIGHVATLGIKWPNDLQIEGKKVGGILTEACIRGAQLEHVVVGFGINVNSQRTDFSAGLQPLVTSLAMATGTTWDRDALLTRCLDRLAQYYQAFVRTGFAAFRDQFLQRSVLEGRRVTVCQGTHEQCGRVIGIDDSGALLVEDLHSGRVVALQTGEVSVMHPLDAR